MRHTMPREFYVPAGSIKVCDKASDAIAYIYERSGNLYAMMFFGKQAKPVWHHRFKSADKRAAHVVDSFKSRQTSVASKAATNAQRNKAHKLEAGHILSASWGYEQTNVDFYQVTKVISTTMVEVRPIGSIDASRGNEPSMTGQVVPALDCFTGEPLRRRVSWGDSVSIDSSRRARLWNGRPVHWTGYH